MDRIRSVRIFTELVAGVKAADEVLVLVDAETIQTGELLATMARSIGADVVFTIYRGENFHGDEPNKIVTNAIAGADVCLTTIHGLTHTLAVKKARTMGLRGVYLVRELSDVKAVVYGDTTTRGLVTLRPGPSLDLTFEDLNAIKERNAKLCDVLATGKRVQITTPRGSDITFSIEGRTPLSLGPFEGRSWDKVDWNLFPKLPNWLGQAEVALAPVTGTAEGIYVVDGQMEGVGLVDEPIAWTVTGGRAVEIKGGRSADILRGILKAADENATNIGEFGIGTNHKATMQIGDKLDKGQYGSVHLALGFQIFEEGVKGEVMSNVHMDGIALNATIVIDEKIIMKDGELLI